MFYVAYGSNISKKRMHERCPNAKFITRGCLDHTVLCFHYYANIDSAHDYAVPVVLWDIPESEVAALDRAEGFPKHYIKDKVLVIPQPRMTVEEMMTLVGADNVHIQRDFMDDPNGIWGTTYIMTDWKKNKWEKHDKQTPIKYVKHLLDGYKEQDFDGLYLQDLWYALYRGEKPPESRT